MVESEEREETEAGLFPQSVGERLRVLREAAKMDLNDIATKTRIPLRHLNAIERGDYAALPSPTYAMGFARSYARALDADDAPLLAKLREELGREDPALRGQLPYEPVDPARVPSRFLAWTAAGLAVLLAIGYSLWRSQYYGDDPVTPVPADTSVEAPVVAVPGTSPRQATPSAPEAAPVGDVVLTATAPVWVRVYDAKKVNLIEKELAPGETFAVPATADNPQIRTGRPEALKVTVGGREVAPLGLPAEQIKDVRISAAALVARPPAPVVPAAPAVAPAL